jgi:hypothetical protein
MAKIRAFAKRVLKGKLGSFKNPLPAKTYNVDEIGWC